MTPPSEAERQRERTISRIVEGRGPDQYLGPARELVRQCEAELNGNTGALDEAPPLDRFRPGGAAILDEPEQVPAVWGDGDEVLWAKGEPLLIVAPPGAGKTTILQQLARARVGVGPERVLGQHVEPDIRPVAYAASDRPKQALRSFRRMTSEEERDPLDLGLLVWEGPLPFNLSANPDRFVPFLQERDVGTVFLDALGNVALDLTKDEAGARVAYAWQAAIAAGIEVGSGHHQRKRDGQNPKRVRTLEDVYGSQWLTAAAGSVLVIDGDPGDLVVKARHLKQPAGEVGPLELRHDHERGRTYVIDGGDLTEAVGPDGITVAEAARHLYGATEPTKNEREKARRVLNRLVDRGRLALGKAGSRTESAIYVRAEA
ncbi:MAG: AAA family ATPase [Actinomycetota bacterium]